MQFVTFIMLTLEGKYRPTLGLVEDDDKVKFVAFMKSEDKLKDAIDRLKETEEPTEITLPGVQFFYNPVQCDSLGEVWYKDLVKANS